MMYKNKGIHYYIDIFTHSWLNILNLQIYILVYNFIILKLNCAYLVLIKLGVYMGNPEASEPCGTILEFALTSETVAL